MLVTHDPIEALVLARHLVVLEGGRATQQGPAPEVAGAPLSAWAAELVGSTGCRVRAGGTAWS